MIIATGIVVLLLGLYIVYEAVKSLKTGKTENREDGFPPIVRKKSPVHFYFSTISCLIGGIAFVVFGVLMVWVQMAK